MQAVRKRGLMQEGISGGRHEARVEMREGGRECGMDGEEGSKRGRNGFISLDPLPPNRQSVNKSHRIIAFGISSSIIFGEVRRHWIAMITTHRFGSDLECHELQLTPLVIC